MIPAVDIRREPYLEIRDRQSRQLVTAVELLSPTNKRRGRTASNTFASVTSTSRPGSI